VRRRSLASRIPITRGDVGGGGTEGRRRMERARGYTSAKSDLAMEEHIVVGFAWRMLWKRG